MQVTMNRIMKALVIGMIEAVRAETTCSCEERITKIRKVIALLHETQGSRQRRTLPQSQMGTGSSVRLQ